MSKLTITSFLSLDGVVHSPYACAKDLRTDLQGGGWLAHHPEPDFDHHMCESLLTADALLLGRKTYETLAERWGVVDPDDPLALTLTLLPKYVVSSTLQQTEWHNSQLVRGDVLQEVVKLKCGHHGEIQIYGSAQLAQSLIAKDLIDEYQLWFFPVLLGSGKRLFNGGNLPSMLTLVDTQTTSAGVVINTYQRVGPQNDPSSAADCIQCGDVVDRVRIGAVSASPQTKAPSNGHGGQ